MLSEAIAIVCAPSKQPSVGIFSLSDEGMSELSICAKSGFHQHSKQYILYGQATHVKFDDTIQCQVIDLR